MVEIKPANHIKPYLKYLEQDTDYKDATIKGRKSALNEFQPYCIKQDLTLNTEEIDQSIDRIEAFYKQTEINIHKTKTQAICDFLDYIAEQQKKTPRKKLKEIKREVNYNKVKEKGKKQSKGISEAEIENKLLTKNQVKSAKKKAGERTELIINILMDTACRPGELVAMNPEKVDFEENSFYINETWNPSKREMQDEPKHGSERTVRMKPGTVEMLETYIEENEIEDDEYIFSYKNDIYRGVKKAYNKAKVRMRYKCKNCKTYYKEHRSKCRSCGSGLKSEKETVVTPYFHRHTKCTEMANNENNSINRVKDYMGHENLETTQTYLHVDKKTAIEVEI